MWDRTTTAYAMTSFPDWRRDLPGRWLRKAEGEGVEPSPPKRCPAFETGVGTNPDRTLQEREVMPTHFTSKLYDEEQSFQDFVYTCARAFGYLFPLRDSPPSSKLPNSMEEMYQRELDNYEDKLVLAERGLSELMDIDKEKLKKKLQGEFKARCAEHEKQKKIYFARLRRFQAMHDEIKRRKWPAELEGLKKFMLEQLGLELQNRAYLDNYYNTDLIPESVDQYIERKRHGLKQDAATAAEDLKRLKKHIKDGNAWFAALRKTVKG